MQNERLKSFLKRISDKNEWKGDKVAKDVQKFITELKKNNIRMTSQRSAILDYLAIEGNHPTANEIYEALKHENPNMSVATIYNNLHFFKEAGILQELPFGDGSSRYDLTESRHYHAVCMTCGKVVDFDYPELENAKQFIESQIDFKVMDHDFKVTGLCEQCKNSM